MSVTAGFTPTDAQPPSEAQALPLDIQIVPLKGLPIEDRIYSHVGAERDAFYLTDPLGKAVAGGGMWTAVDLYVGLILGPIMGGLSPPARVEFASKFMPKMVLLMPTLVMMTLASGFQIAIKYGNLYPDAVNKPWLVASMVVVGIMAIIALGILEPANIAVLFEMKKPQPDVEVIDRLMKRFVYTAGVTGVMQIATLLIMTRVATQ